MEDIDGDGRNELTSYAPDWDKGKAFADAPLIKVVRRWTGQHFEEVGSIR